MIKNIFRKNRQNRHYAEMSLESYMNMLSFRHIYTLRAIEAFLCAIILPVFLVIFTALYFQISDIGIFAHCQNIPSGDICNIRFGE